jgi:radical SAM superfamily enzyme YgiQ (UPF0313 family)
MEMNFLKSTSIPAEQLTFKQYGTTEKSDRKIILCISPPLEDVNLFTGIWQQNMGLLKIASYLKNRKGYKVYYIDGLNPEYRKDGSCKIKRKLIERRDIGGINKSVYHWGYSYDEIIERIKNLPRPDKVYMSVIMTYHYRSVFKITKIIKKIYPDVPVVIGGISPTLIPQWYNDWVKKNGWKDVKIIVGDWNKGKAKLERTDFELLKPHIPNFAMIASSYGCPFRCSFCARERLNCKVILRRPEDVVAEMKEKYNRWHVKRFYFIDDNIAVHEKGAHFEHLLDLIIESGIRFDCEFVEGFSPHLLTEKILEKMHKAGSKRMYFGFETSDEAMRKRFHKAHKLEDLYRMRKWAWRHGFKKHDGISFYTLMGMPDQSLESVVDSILECMKFGALPVPKEFTPIPFTAEWEKYGHLVKGKDPFDLIGDFYPFAEYNKISPVEYEKLQAFVQGERKMQSYSFHFPKRLDLTSSGLFETILRKTLTGKAKRRKEHGKV